MEEMKSVDFFSCDLCHVECRIDSETQDPNTTPIIMRHCPDSKGVAVIGKVTRFQERRGGLWADVQRWIDAA